MHEPDRSTRAYLEDLASQKVDPPRDYPFRGDPPSTAQAVIFEFFRHFPNIFVCGDPGVGKTRSVIDVLDYQADLGGLQRVLVVCPNSIKRNWKHEIEGKWSRRYVDSVFILPDSKKKREKLLDRFPPGIYIANFERVRAMQAAGNSLALLDWDWVIVDESSKIKHRQSKQSKALHAFDDVCSLARRVILTGTPVTKSPMDFWSQFRFLQSSVFGKTFRDYQNRYAVTIIERLPGRKPFIRETGYRNLDELREKAFSIGVSIRKEDWLDLPEKVYVERYVQLPKPVQKVYDEMAQTLVAEIELEIDKAFDLASNVPDEEEREAQALTISASNVLAKLSKLRQITSGFIYDGIGDARRVIELASRPKLDELISMIDEIDGPFLVWAIYREDIAAIEERLLKEGITTESIHGGVNLDDREAIVRAFQEDNESIRTLVCQTSACAYGLTLTAASTAIVYSRDANLEHRLQMADRIHRIGQKRTSTIIDLVVENSVDEMDLDILEGKFKLAEEVTKHKPADLMEMLAKYRRNR